MQLPLIATERRFVRQWRTSSAWLRPRSSSEPSLRYWTPLSRSGMDLHSPGRAPAPPWYTSRVSLVSVSTARSSTEGGKGGDRDTREEEEEEEEEDKWEKGCDREEEQLDMERPQVSMRLEGDRDGASLSGPPSSASA